MTQETRLNQTCSTGLKELCMALACIFLARSLIASLPAHARDEQNTEIACEEAPPMGPNTVQKIHLGYDQRGRFFQEDAAMAGVLGLEVADLSRGTLHPRIDFVGTSCDGGTISRFSKRSGAWVIKVNQPAKYIWRVSTESKDGMGSYRMQVSSSGAFPTFQVPFKARLEGLPRKNEEWEEDDMSGGSKATLD